ncbi:MAG: HAD hydrolase family protein [Verrucomicrobiae bacterium]|jgi:HAD superfamily hydrolase (TIGR01484 family)|nr:HAD hydrolase family protein [Verrucomicrobiae bacterium]
MLKLLATDFDGTSIGYTPHESCVDCLALALEKIKNDEIVWSINTGRDFLYLLEGLEYFNAPVEPDYIITSERHLYRHDKKKGWKPFEEWNRHCDSLHAELFRKSGRFFEQIKNLIAQYSDETTLLENHDGVPEMLIAEKEELLDEIVLQVDSLPHRPNNFSFQRSSHYMRFCHKHYDKGKVLRELSSLLSLQANNILAIGDHYNDLSMLDGEVASMVACPSNAHREVKAIVQKANGRISQYEAGEGTAEAIHYYYQKFNKKK